MKGSGTVVVFEEGTGAAESAVAIQPSSAKIEGLSRGEAQLEIDDGGLLILGWGRGRLGMGQGGVNRLVHQIRDQVPLKSRGGGEGLNGFAAVKHDRAEISQIW